MIALLRLTLVLGVLASGVTRASNPKVEVNVVVDMTEAGRKVAPPTKEKPAYYFPIVAGYHEEGAIVAGEKAPPKNMVIHELAKALAVQGYRVVSAQTPPPSLLLVLYWGYMNPQIDDFGDADNPQKVFF